MSNIYKYMPGMLRPGPRLKGTWSLPHSCDDWILGTTDNLKDLVQDLQAAINGTYTYDEDAYDEDAAFADAYKDPDESEDWE